MSWHNNLNQTYYLHAEENSYRKIEAKHVSMYKRLIERHNPTEIKRHK